MPTLTIEAIRTNPLSVLTHTLPSNPTKLLLKAALLAADYCCRTEYILMEAAREGEYIPAGWTPAADQPDIHEINEARWVEAGDKVDLIRALHEKM